MSIKFRQVLAMAVAIAATVWGTTSFAAPHYERAQKNVSATSAQWASSKGVLTLYGDELLAVPGAGPGLPMLAVLDGGPPASRFPFYNEVAAETSSGWLTQAEAAVKTTFVPGKVTGVLSTLLLLVFFLLRRSP